MPIAAPQPERPTVSRGPSCVVYLPGIFRRSVRPDCAGLSCTSGGGRSLRKMTKNSCDRGVPYGVVSVSCRFWAPLWFAEHCPDRWQIALEISPLREWLRDRAQAPVLVARIRRKLTKPWPIFLP
jgi:hypothetical protein